MTLLGALYRMVHPIWNHICLTPLGVRKHPAALLVNISLGRKLASQWERCSAATSLLRDWVVNGKYEAKPAPSERIFSLTHFRYLPCKLSSFSDAPSPKSMTHRENHSDGRQNAVNGPLSSSRPPPFCQQTELCLLGYIKWLHFSSYTFAPTLQLWFHVWESQDQTCSGWKRLWVSLIQPSTQIEVKCRSRPGCSGLFPSVFPKQCDVLYNQI